MKKILVAAAVLAILALVVWASLRGDRGPEGVEVDARVVERDEIRRVVKASGAIDPREKVELSAHVVARIEKLYVEEGDDVEAGQPVLELERQNYRAAVEDWKARMAQARSSVRKAEADLENALAQERRYRRLAREGVVSEERLETAEVAATAARVALEQAREQVAQSRANLDKAQDDLRKTTIYAPISGRVIDLNAEEGEVVVSGTMNNPASVIATLADLSDVLAVVDVDETEVVYVDVGQDAELTVDALPERTFAGRVVEVGSSGFSRADQPDVTFFRTKVLFEEPDPALRPGMSVRAEIVTAVHPDALVVPIQSVVERVPVADPDADEGAADADPAEDADGEVPVVFVVEEGRVRQRPVETGIADATRVEITGGLEAGEVVVTGPYRELRDLEHGDAVEVEDLEGDGEDRRQGGGEDGDGAEDGDGGGGDGAPTAESEDRE